MVTKKIIFHFLLGAFIFTLHVNADDATSWDAGKTFGTNYGSYYGNNMKSELFTPMTSDNNFKTKDGAKTFKANMTCGDSSKSFMSVTYTIGSPQNGAVPVIQIDKNLDGTKEYSFTSPYTASAICTNGIAVCTNGAFDGAGGCNYYSWSYDGTSISLKLTDPKQMSSCSCINNTCGALASTQKDTISNKIASGIYAVLSSYSSSYIVSQTQTNNGIVEYFGQKTDNCQNFQGTAPTTGVNTSMDASSQMMNQSADSKSPYSSLLGGSSNYATNSAPLTSKVGSTTSSSKTIRTSITHTDGTTDFATKDANGTTLFGHVGIPLDSDNKEYCQVKWLEQANDVFTDNTERSTSTTSGEQWRIETRECTNHICPFQASKGESVKHECGNINNFAEATSAFSAVQELANDITCGSL